MGSQTHTGIICCQRKNGLWVESFVLVPAKDRTQGRDLAEVVLVASRLISKEFNTNAHHSTESSVCFSSGSTGLLQLIVVGNGRKDRSGSRVISYEFEVDHCTGEFIGDVRRKTLPPLMSTEARSVAPSCNMKSLYLVYPKTSLVQQLDLQNPRGWTTIQKPKSSYTTGSIPQGPMPEKGRVISQGSFLYLAGGLNRAFTAQVWRYHISAGQWFECAPLNVKRHRFGFCEIPQRHCLVAVGGFDGRTLLESVEIYDTNTLKWEISHAVLNSGREQHQVAMIGEFLVVCGGLDRRQRPHKTVEMIHLEELFSGKPQTFTTCELFQEPPQSVLCIVSLMHLTELFSNCPHLSRESTNSGPSDASRDEIEGEHILTIQDYAQEPVVPVTLSTSTRSPPFLTPREPLELHVRRRHRRVVHCRGTQTDLDYLYRDVDKLMDWVMAGQVGTPCQERCRKAH